MNRRGPVCRRAGLVACLAFGGSMIAAAAQSASAQFRPELDVFAQLGDSLRIEFDNRVTDTTSTQNWQGYFAYYVEAALKPIFRRNLREQPDVYRNRYLVMRAGYLYQTSLSSGKPSSGNIGILELTSRYRVPGDLVITDRNRGEARFIKGESFYTRYRNQLRLERDFRYRHFVGTPYAYDEIFYNTRYGAWTPNRYAFGVQLPAGRHMLFDVYYMRQDGSRNKPPHINAAGLKWDLYF